MGEPKLTLNLTTEPVKPTEVRITNHSSYALKLNQKATIECQAAGSKPEARVRWFRGQTELDAGELSRVEQLSGAQFYISEFNRDNDNNLTKVSHLTFVPQLSDHKQSLVCSASNPKMPNISPISDSITMNVLCKFH